MKSLIPNDIYSVTIAKRRYASKMFLTRRHWYGFDQKDCPIVKVKYYVDTNLPNEVCRLCDKMLPIRGNAVMVKRRRDKRTVYYHYYCSDKCMIGDLL